MPLTEYTITDYLTARLIRLGIELSDVELTVLFLNFMPIGLNPDDVLCKANIPFADKATLYGVRDLLIMPDVQEGGYSIKYDKDSVQKWYNAEVERLGLADDPGFSITPKIRDASNRW